MIEQVAREFYEFLESIAAKVRTGLAFSPNPYDISRYNEILKDLDNIYQLLSTEDGLSQIFSFLKNSPVDVGCQEYITPKVAVAVVSFNAQDEILLVKRKDNLWSLPGGYADIPLDPVQNAEKEVIEETGLSVSIRDLIGIYDSNINKFPSVGRQVYLLVFYGILSDGELKPDPIETKGAAFFNLSSLPDMPSITLSQINYGVRFHNGELLPTLVEHHSLT